MCGIAAIVGEASPKTRLDLQSMLKNLEHRGRPGSLYEVEQFDDCNCIFGTNRLPIVDVTEGAQPKHSITDKFTVIMNGEIFNYVEIRRSLIEQGFLSTDDKSLGDTAILANALEAWGVDRTLSTLNWEGAFIALDASNRQVVAARDHLGIKPLYVCHDQGRLFLASEIKALLDVTTSEIRPIMPGTVERFSVDETVKRIVHRWWSPTPRKDARARIEDFDERLISALRKSVAARVPDGPYAVLLSGGLDSSLILRFAIETNPDTTAYVLCTPNSPDLPFARGLCEELGVRLIEVQGIERSQLNRNISDLINCVESWEWHVLNHSAPMDVLFETIRAADHKVVLTGEGADELFCGYNQWDVDANALECERLKRIEDLHRTNCRRLDRMGMRHGLECRVPFLDKELVELALEISPSMCVSRETNKIPLRRIAAGLINPNIITRKKLSLAKGAGYAHNFEENSDNFTQNPSSYNDEIAFERNKLLPRFDVERFYLRKFIESGLYRAPYLLSRSI